MRLPGNGRNVLQNHQSRADLAKIFSCTAANAKGLTKKALAPYLRADFLRSQHGVFQWKLFLVRIRSVRNAA
ncbi:hypothetical protein [Primorskyibacter flagellatus]|uniref:hypothetical protein n=1 Tax=Primorskyibacter flagellatus TaxID=1387277 RepID=UPI00117B816D|nr:hypothetical protein [Primorskyibacter flagellatus]